MLPKYAVVQFNEKHKWCGSLGIIDSVKKVKDDVIYMIGVPMPMQGVAFIRVGESENALEFIGMASLKMVDNDD